MLGMMMRLFRRAPHHPLEDLASSAANVIRHQLTRLNLAYRVKHRDGEEVQRVEFVEPLIATPHEIRLEIDVNRLPRGVTITDLRKPDVLETLSVACKHPIRAEQKKGKGGGFWFVLEIAERSAIPKLIKYGAMQLPAGAAPLSIPIGVGANGAQRWEDLRDLPHLLIAGATKQGKSVMVNAIVCSIARRLGPERLQLYLCDLKGGMELAYYEGLPHVQQFVTRAIELPAMLAGLQIELDRRTTLMRGVARDLDGYNYQVGRAKALPYIVVIIDEIANAMLSSSKVTIEIGEESKKGTVASLSEEYMADLAARARAVGIHLIISTQRPSVDVVTGLIKANFPCRIAFGTASEIDSRVIIDDPSAAGQPAGRMRFRRNMELLEYQAPFLSDQDVRDQVAAIVAGEPADEAPESAEDIAQREILKLLETSEELYGGKFPIKELARSTKIAFGRVEEHAKRLESESILRRQFGPRPRTIIGDWRAQYRPSVMRHASRDDRPSEPALRLLTASEDQP